MTTSEIQTLLQKEFPNYQMKVESCENRCARIILYINNSHLRPGVTVSGPSMMLLADLAMYAAILNTIGSVVLAVTTNLNINFLRKPVPSRNLLGDSTLIKVGKRLIVGEVQLVLHCPASCLASQVLRHAQRSGVIVLFIPPPPSPDPST